MHCTDGMDIEHRATDVGVECNVGDAAAAQLMGTDVEAESGWTLAPKAAAGAMGAGVDCAGPDAGSMMHTMALGADSLPVQPPPPRPRGVTRTIDVHGDAEQGVADTVKFTFHGATHTLACVLQAGLSVYEDEVDFAGVLAERLPNGRVVTLLLRTKNASDAALADRLVIRALQTVSQRLQMFKRAAFECVSVAC